MRPPGFVVDPGLRVVFDTLGVSPADVFRRAGQPEDLLARAPVTLDTPAFFAVWEAMGDVLDAPDVGLVIAQAITPDVFTPSVFTFLCSPDLCTALRRVAQFKPLVCPMAMAVRTAEDRTLTLTMQWTAAEADPPTSLIGFELGWLVHLARLATRQPIRVVRAASPVDVGAPEAFRGFLGVAVERGPRVSLTFAAEDAERPFLTANAGMWSVFEPDLRRRLAVLEAEASTAERVRGVLLEALPTGRATVDDVGRRLAMSRRTLQRRLKDEGTAFQEVLRRTRTDLARHYLRNTTLSSTEIGFLLGFEETTSFFRAFHDWTGMTPEAARVQA